MDNNQDDLSKVIINGQEFDAAEAQTLIDLGNKTREIETKLNTKLENVYPEYTKATQERAQYQKERDEAREQLKGFQTKKDEGVETPKDVREAQDAARKLNIVLNDDLEKAGYIKKDDLDSYFQTKEQEKQAISQVLSQADNLEKEIDGADGRTKFNKKAVMAYASAYGFSDLLKAYEEMNEDSLKPWREAQIAAQQKASLKTLRGTSGNKTPQETRVTKDNFKDALSESLWGN